mgnify:CR=1 FL=1
MPELIIPEVADGDTIDPTTVNLMFNDPVSPDDSLSIINGVLDWQNFNEDTRVAAEHTQRGSAIRGWAVSGTANLDWRWTWFGDYVNPSVTAFSLDDSDPIQYIPGTCVEFYMPWDGCAWLFPQVFWFNDHYADAGPRSDMLLIVDGDFESSQRRSVVWGGTGPSAPKGYSNHRAWSGHACVELTRGWHRAGIALLARGYVSNVGFRNTRTYACSMAVLTCKLS